MGSHITIVSHNALSSVYYNEKAKKIDQNEKRYVSVTHSNFGNTKEVAVGDVCDTCNRSSHREMCCLSCPFTPERAHRYEYLQNTSQQESHMRSNESTARDRPQIGQVPQRQTEGERPGSRASDYITLGYTPGYSYTGSMNQSNRISTTSSE